MEIREVVRLLTILLVVGYLNEPLSINADPASDSSSHSSHDALVPVILIVLRQLKRCTSNAVKGNQLIISTQVTLKYHITLKSI